MYLTIERKHVMFAKRIEIDVLDDNHLVASLFMKDCPP
jgi:hypothetical protein